MQPYVLVRYRSYIMKRDRRRVGGWHCLVLSQPGGVYCGTANNSVCTARVELNCGSFIGY